MKTLIDSLESTTGWVMSPGSSIVSDAWPDKIASNLASSLKFNLLLGGTATKYFGSSAGIGTADHKWVGFNQCFNLQSEMYEELSEFALKIEIGWNTGAKEYYVPLTHQFDRSIFRTEGSDSILYLRFTALKAVQFFASEFIAFTPNYPYDIYLGLQAELEAAIAEFYPIQVGVATVTAGDLQITIENWEILNRYALISFGQETHKIDKFNDDGEATFFSTEDGVSVLANYTDEPINLLIPVLKNPSDVAYTSPSVAIRGGFAPPLWVTNPFRSEDWDTWNIDGTRFEGMKGDVLEYEIQVDGFARSYDSLEIIKTAIRRAFEKGFIWVNGIRIEWPESATPVYQELPSNDDKVLQISFVYNFRIEEDPEYTFKASQVGLQVVAEVNFLGEQ